MAEAQPAGVRLAFRTAATVVELDAQRTTLVYAGLPPRPDGVYDVLVDGSLVDSATSVGGNVVSIDMSTGTTMTTTGAIGTMKFTLAPGDKNVEIWLPHNETIELVELRSDAPIHPAPEATRPRWINYGSSISQGSNAGSPSATWSALVASAHGLELINLGFSGSAMLDPFVARVVRDEPADLISLEIGINLVNSDAMRLRAFVPAVHGFLDTVRDGHPETPIIVVSPIYCPIHENTPGPGAFDPASLSEGKIAFMATGEPGPGKLTLTVIRDELERIVTAREDPNLTYVNGLDLYGESDFDEFPLLDRLHPDTESHRRIGTRFSEILKQRK